MLPDMYICMRTHILRPEQDGSDMNKLGKSNLCDTVMKELLKMIEDGTFKEGEQLPNELVLAEQMGISRTTLREAKNNLVSMNILTKHRGRGTFVVDRHARQEMRQEIDNLNYDQARLAALYELRTMMEPDIAFLAAEKATDEELKKIARIQDELEAAGDENIQVMELNGAFHDAICEATHNEFVIKIFKNINQAIRNNFDVSGGESVATERALRSHRLIVSFLKLRDGTGARDAMELHLKESMEELRLVSYDTKQTV